MSVTNFYRRRVARLFPAYLALIAVVIAFAGTGMFGNRADIRLGVVSSFTYTANWFGVSRGLGALGPFAHLWSLSVEEQFYLLWPIALVALLRHRSPARVGRLLTFVVPVLFAVLCARSLIWPNERNLYTGTDGQALPFLLIGCALALFLGAGTAPSMPFAQWAKRWGAWCVLPLVPFVVFGEHGNAHVYYYRGGLAFVAVCMLGILLAALVDSPVRLAMSAPVLVWLGVRSYSIYLWHYPMVFVVPWMQRQLGVDFGHYGRAAVAAVLTIMLAMASYRFVEQPMRARIAGARTPAVT
jgi:peptidoglycan/LPS O-acetylase OafA/YrhL